MSTTPIRELLFRERLQLQVYAVVAAGAFALVAVLDAAGPPLFRRWLGGWNPPIVALIIAAAGLVALSWFVARGEFAIYRKGGRNGFTRAAVLAALFGAVAIVTDFRIVWPADMNVPLPWALLFYSAVAFVAEILFHALPLALLLWALAIWRTGRRRSVLLILCLVLAALPEPVYQVRWMILSGPHPLWAMVFVAVHVFLINLAGLLLFRRYDFVTMLAFRLMYYLIWHIAWGTLRLHVLF